jgi:uncharacterized protein
MKFLLDVNALVALGFRQHVFHAPVSAWVQQSARHDQFELATCSITELGFVRILSQAPQYGLAVAQARDLLLHLRRMNRLHFSFIADDLDISHLPAWINSAKHITDGHLLQLAKANSALLATLDRGIPGAFLIPI